MPTISAVLLTEIVGGLESAEAKVGEGEEMRIFGISWFECMKATSNEVGVVEHVVIEVVVDQLSHLRGRHAVGRHDGLERSE